jgi:hypothetical protein
MKTLVLSFVIFAALTGQAWAASCYTQKEAEAEQAIRIHSELMVIGLNCQHMRFKDGTNLYLKYRQFASQHSDLFAGYEATLIEYHRRNGAGNPQRKLDDMRTLLANNIANDSATMSPDQFCNRFVPRIFKAAQMSRSELATWAGTLYPSHPVSQPICR